MSEAVENVHSKRGPKPQPMKEIIAMGVFKTSTDDELSAKAKHKRDHGWREMWRGVPGGVPGYSGHMEDVYLDQFIERIDCEEQVTLTPELAARIKARREFLEAQARQQTEAERQTDTDPEKDEELFEP